MQTLPGKSLKWRPRGLSDAVDGSNSFPGAMMQLANLVPDPHNKGSWVPRPASASLTTFGSFTSPAQVTALLEIGNIVYGMVAETSGAFNGKDVPFAFNVVTSTFETITIPGGAASLPTTPSNTGDWTPPTMTAVGALIVITHPGYTGGVHPFFGWLDISGFSSNTITGSTHATTTIDTLSASALAAGWQPGMTITDSSGDIPANATIVSIAANGLSVVISAAATGSHAGDTLTVNGGTATAPLYGSGNTNLNVLPAVPTCCGQFSGRAYFGVPGNGIYFTDALVPRQITNATQKLNPANGLDITAFGGLPIAQTTGGNLQSLIGFQGDSQMQQITGDLVTSNLTLASLLTGVGTLAPNTICTTGAGLAFVAPDGLRILQFSGQVSDPIGANGDGVCIPFLTAINPSRMCAAFNQNVLRISVKNGNAAGQPVQEYWYDMSLKVWSGPHSFPAALIQPYQGNPDHGFTLSASGVNATLWSSSPTPTNSDTYTENSLAMSWTYQTVLLPDEDDMANHKMVLATLTASIGAQQQVTVQLLDEGSNILDTITIAGPALAPTTWNNFTWGNALWGGPGSFLYQHPLGWHQPIIFKQMTAVVNGNSALNTIIGNLNMQIESLGYLTQATG